MTNTVIVVNRTCERKSTVVAYFIWFLFGPTGWQNFYAGRKGLGWAELAAFVAICCGILCGLDEPWDDGPKMFVAVLAILIGGFEVFDLCTLWYAVKKNNLKVDKEESLVKQNTAQPQIQA